MRTSYKNEGRVISDLAYISSQSTKKIQYRIIQAIRVLEIKQYNISNYTFITCQ